MVHLTRDFLRKHRLIARILCACMLFMPCAAHADYSIVDSLNLAPVVPVVLDAMMMIATGAYDFFVGRGGGIIYILIWICLGVWIAMYVVKMFLPEKWLGFIGMSGGGQMSGDKTPTPTGMATDVLKPMFRAIIAALVLLQIRPVFVTRWLVRPFLEFGALYTDAIVGTMEIPGVVVPNISCPPDVVAHEWVSQSGCEFLIRPVATLSAANNHIVKTGLSYMISGLGDMATLFVHGGARGFMNLITGLMLVITFAGCNFFMAMLVIQAIFNFGMSLVLYPFSVLTWVVNPKNSKNGWVDVWPAFTGITTALQKLIVTMIACAFITCINAAIVNAMFHWNNSVFVSAAGGTATSNVPQIASTSAAMFGRHSILWISAILTFYIMLRIFDLTRRQLNDYVGSDMSGMYNRARSDVNAGIGMLKKAKDWIKKNK